MVTGFDKLEATLLQGKTGFYCFCGLIVHDVNFGGVSFAHKKFKVCFVHIQNSLRIEAGNRHHKDGVYFIVIHHKKTYVASKRHEGKIPSTVIIHGTCVLVGEGTKTEDVCNGFIVYVINESESWFVSIVGGDKAWHDVLMDARGMVQVLKGGCIN